MNDITANQQRNPQPAFLDSESLQLVDDVNISLVNHRTDGPRPDGRRKIIRRMAFTGIELAHLPDLLGKRHSRQQIRDPLLNRVRLIQ